MKKTTLILLAFFAFATSSVKAFEPTGEDYVFINPEVMPRFSGDLFRWLAENLVYPPEAIEARVQERIIVQFIIERDGSVSDIEILWGQNPYLRAEAIRLVESMPKKWTPGMQRGQPVRVRFSQPIHFRITTDPTFPGNVQNWIRENKVYPRRAARRGIQEQIVVQFTVRRDGSITDAEVVKGRNRHLRAEAIRLVESMPKWRPGIIMGRVVDKSTSVSIDFRLPR